MRSNNVTYRECKDVMLTFTCMTSNDIMAVTTQLYINSGDPYSMLPINPHIYGDQCGQSGGCICLCNWSSVEWLLHYSHVIISPMASQKPASPLFTQPFVQAQTKENIKAPRHWPLWGEFTGDRWIPRTKGQQHGKCFHLMTSSSLLQCISPILIECLFYLIDLISWC